MARPTAERRQQKVSVRLFKSTGGRSAIDRVVEKFKLLLRDGKLKPGDKIPNEMELAKSFETSRGSIREAVKMLVSFGILQVKWGDGTYVSSSISENAFDHQLYQLLVSTSDSRHLMELREIMEYAVARLAVEHGEDDDLERIENAHQTLKEMILGGEADPDRLAIADAAFHRAISTAGHNPLIDKIYQFAIELYYPSIVVTHGNRGTLEERMQTPNVHQEILDAIRARDKKRTDLAVRSSLDTWFHLL